MPVDDGEAQVVLERLAVDEFVGIIIFKFERILGLGTAVLDLGHVGKSWAIGGSHWFGQPVDRYRHPSHHGNVAVAQGNRAVGGRNWSVGQVVRVRVREASAEPTIIPSIRRRPSPCSDRPGFDERVLTVVETLVVDWRSRYF